MTDGIMFAILYGVAPLGLAAVVYLLLRRLSSRAAWYLMAFVLVSAVAVGYFWSSGSLLGGTTLALLAGVPICGSLLPLVVLSPDRRSALGCFLLSFAGYVTGIGAGWRLAAGLNHGGI